MYLYIKMVVAKIYDNKSLYLPLVNRHRADLFNAESFIGCLTNP